MKCAVVTGSNSGIGAAIARRLSSEGCRVIGVDWRHGDVVENLAERGGRATAAKKILALSGGRIDHVVCCAGLGPQFEDVRAIASVNYFGCVELLDALLPALGNSQHASAVAITSVDGSLFPLRHPDTRLRDAYLQHDEAAVHSLLQAFDPAAYRGAVAYGTSKQAASIAVRQRAPSWGRGGVRLNAVAPGAVETPLLAAGEKDPRYAEAIKAFVAPLGRRGRPDEIASLACYLLSREASFIHGSVVTVDGGIDAQYRPMDF